eukprot:6442095-Alexandrium_andersonii.AAC.1
MGPDIGEVGTASLLDSWKRFLALSLALGIGIPKSHLMVHLIPRAQQLGNLLLYQRFLDESLNSELKRAVRLCHQARFDELAL